MCSEASFASESRICFFFFFKKHLPYAFSSVPALHSVWTTTQQTDCKVVIYFSFTHSQKEWKHTDGGLLMFMLSSCQSGGELSGSGSVNWALIRCCSN